VKGKMTRKPMTHTIEHHAMDVNDKWVSDVIGPVRQRTLGGNRYVLVTVDVYSHIVWVILMKRKSEVTNEIKKLMKREQTQKEKTVKVFHTDGGGEFVNEEMNQFLTENGTYYNNSTHITAQCNSRTYEQDTRRDGEIDDVPCSCSCSSMG
jgi:hypothetical protein